MKRIFTFGCSFTSFSWPTWADILIEDYKNKGFEGYNYGRCGAGNQYIFVKLMEANIKYKFTKDDLILVCWTTMQREDRFVNNGWITPGSIYSQNIYTNDFVNAWADPTFYVLRDCAIMEAVNLSLKTVGCEFYQFSMSPLSQLDSANADLIFKETNNIIDFYKDYTKLDFIPMMEYLGLIDRSPEAQNKRPLTYWGHDNPKNIIPEWHPTVEEHYRYLQNVIQSKVHIELEDKTKTFVNKWIDFLATSQYPLDLNKTGWTNNYNDDIIDMNNKLDTKTNTNKKLI